MGLSAKQKYTIHSYEKFKILFFEKKFIDISWMTAYSVELLYMFSTHTCVLQNVFESLKKFVHDILVFAIFMWQNLLVLIIKSHGGKIK